MSQLYTWNQENVDLHAAIEQWSGSLGSPVCALLYSLAHCTLALVSDSKLTDSHGVDVSLSDVFEARLFGPDAELRWLRTGTTGRAALLAEKDLQPDPPGTHTIEEIVESIPGQYLLWGSGAPSRRLARGWSSVAEARVGALDVPVAGIGEKERVALEYREYCAVCDNHGNVAVMEERLLGLKRWDPREKRNG